MKTHRGAETKDLKYAW